LAIDKALIEAALRLVDAVIQFENDGNGQGPRVPAPIAPVLYDYTESEIKTPDREIEGPNKRTKR